MHFVYIIYSQSADKYYIGETNDLLGRVNLHNSKQFQNAFTTFADDWELFWSLQCNNLSQARKIEKHIKSMKSRTYIENIKKYNEISVKLLEKYR
ncbi:MAG TPA: GIY-YIG nuclease family protein [Flavobacterium sp.]|nr:GIY-YIG nuclease family protein [Flavobacterium sp.]